ncbi:MULTISPECIES: hypothetical protein [unclassified Streptomyces]|uniref:hypothetical protein n=1 Tax=unclassified Streptomyces TaxID=2593676 RepID=UPI0037F84ABA
MSEYQDHIRQSLDGTHYDPAEDLGIDEMRWSTAPVSKPVADEAVSAAEKAHALLDRAADAYLSLLNAVLGDGTHHVVASANTQHGEPAEGQQLTVLGDAIIIDEAAALRVCTVIAAAMVRGSTGGVVVRTFGPDGSESVRGWSVRNLWLRPLSADSIREASSFHPETGAPLAPEPGVEFRQAERVPRPTQTRGAGATSHTAPRCNRPPNRRN